MGTPCRRAYVCLFLRRKAHSSLVARAEARFHVFQTANLQRIYSHFLWLFWFFFLLWRTFGNRKIWCHLTYSLFTLIFLNGFAMNLCFITMFIHVKGGGVENGFRSDQQGKNLDQGHVFLKIHWFKKNSALYWNSQKSYSHFIGILQAKWHFSILTENTLSFS